MILDRYLIREIAKPLIVVTSALVLLFATFTAARYTALVADGLMPGWSIFPLVVLKTVIALEVLLSIALHLSVVLALGRLYTDSEMTALAACGVSSTRILRVVLSISLLVAALVACLSFFARPAAYALRYELENQAVGEFDLNDVEPGRFYQTTSGKHVIYVERLEPDTHLMRGVFIQTRSGGIQRVISAEQAYYRAKGAHLWGELVCFNAHVYEFSPGRDEVMEAQTEELTLPIGGPDAMPLGYKRNAASTWQLADSQSRMDIAEFQWRLSTPLTTVLMGLLGFPLSRTEARRGKYTKLFAAVLVYAACYNLILVAKTWVEQGVVAPAPGVWWVHAVLAAVFVALMWRPAGVLNWRRQSHF